MKLPKYLWLWVFLLWSTSVSVCSARTASLDRTDISKIFQTTLRETLSSIESPFYDLGVFVVENTDTALERAKDLADTASILNYRSSEKALGYVNTALSFVDIYVESLKRGSKNLNSSYGKLGFEVLDVYQNTAAAYFAYADNLYGGISELNESHRELGGVITSTFQRTSSAKEEVAIATEQGAISLPNPSRNNLLYYAPFDTFLSIVSDGVEALLETHRELGKRLADRFFPAEHVVAVLESFDDNKKILDAHLKNTVAQNSRETKEDIGEKVVNQANILKSSTAKAEGFNLSSIFSYIDQKISESNRNLLSEIKKISAKEAPSITNIYQEKTTLADVDNISEATITGTLYDSNESAGQNGFVLQTTGNGVEWVATSTLGISGGGVSVWGDLTGNLSDQTDLQNELNDRLTLSSWYGTTTDALTEGSINLFSQWSETGSDIYFSSGKVGIGDSTPDAPLHIYTTENPGTQRTLLRLESADSQTGTGYNIDFAQGGVVAQRIAGVYEDAGVVGLAFSTYSGGLAEKLRITGAGNVGIGTTSPYAKLSVAGETVAEKFTASLSSATSTFNGGLAAASLSVGGYQMTFPGSAAILARTDAAQTFTGTQTFSGSVLSDTFKFVGAPTTGVRWGNTGGGGTVTFDVGGSVIAGIDSNNLEFIVNKGIVWTNSSSDISSTKDTSLSRISAGVIGIGTGANGSTAGTLIANAIGIGSTTPYTKLSVVGTGSASTPVLSVEPTSGKSQFSVSAPTDTNYGIKIFGAESNTTGTKILSIYTAGGVTPGLTISSASGWNQLAMSLSGDFYADQIISSYDTNSGFIGNSAGAKTGSDGVVSWTSGRNYLSPDTSLSRIAAGVVGVGTGAAGNAGGTIQAATLKLSAGANYFDMTSYSTYAILRINAQDTEATTFGTDGWHILSNDVIGFANGSLNPITNTLDATFSRISSGVIGVGTGAQGSTAGTLIANTIGVGTSNPLGPLGVSHTGANTGAIVVGDQTTSSNNTGIYLRTTSLGTITTASGGQLHLGTGGSGITTSGLRIDASGNVGIGTTTPSKTLHVNGLSLFKNSTGGETSTTRTLDVQNSNGTSIFYITPGNSVGVNIPGTIDIGALTLGAGWQGIGSSASNSSGALTFRTNSGSTERMRIDSSGSVGIGTTSPWRKLSVTGTVGFDGLTSAAGSPSALCLSSDKEVVVNTGTATCTVSSARFKEGISYDTVSGLEAVLSMKPATFKYKDLNIERIGFIAEDVNLVDSRLTFTESDGKTLRGVRYEDMTAVLAKAIQELNGKFEEMKTSFLSGITEFKEIIVSKITSEESHTNKLCVEDVCITRDDLAALLQNSNINLGVDGNNGTDVTVQDGASQATGTTTEPVDETTIQQDILQEGATTEDAVTTEPVETPANTESAPTEEISSSGPSLEEQSQNTTDTAPEPQAEEVSTEAAVTPGE